MPQAQENELRRNLLQGDEGIDEMVARTLTMDLVRADILGPEVANKLINDLLFRIRIDRVVKLSTDETCSIIGSRIDEVNREQTQQDEDRRLMIPESAKGRIQAAVGEGFGKSKGVTFSDVVEPLTHALKSNDVDVSLIPSVLDRVNHGMAAVAASKITFSATDGEVSWLRPWAKHIQIRGPHPQSEILAVYRFKPTHSHSPGTEINPSVTASKEDIGPKIVWSKEIDRRKGVILEEYFTPIEPKTMEPNEVKEAAVNTGLMLYRMYDLSRLGGINLSKVIHSFDGMERGHFNLRRQGESLRPCLVDFGEPKLLTVKNRRGSLAQNIGTLADKIITEWPNGLAACALFELTLEQNAQEMGPHSRFKAAIGGALEDYVREKTSPSVGGMNSVLVKKWQRYRPIIDGMKTQIVDGGLLFDETIPIRPIWKDVDRVDERWKALRERTGEVLNGSNRAIHWIAFDVEKNREPELTMGAYEVLVDGIFAENVFKDKVTAFSRLRSALELPDDFGTRRPSVEDIEKICDALKSKDKPDEVLAKVPDMKLKVSSKIGRGAAGRSYGVKGRSRVRQQRGKRRADLSAGQASYWEILAEEIGAFKE